MLIVSEDPNFITEENNFKRQEMFLTPEIL